MDNFTKDKNENSSSSGEIFSSSTSSAYQEAVNEPIEADVSQQRLAESENETSEQAQSVKIEENHGQFESPVSDFSDLSSSNTPPLAPPPFVENKLKKFFVLGIIFCFIFLVIFLVYRLISSRKSQQPKKDSQIVLTYWGLWEEEENMKLLIDEYQKKHNNIQIKYIQQSPKQYREIVQAAIERGEGPDIFRFHNTWIPMLVNYLSPVPKSIISDNQYEQVFYPVVTYDLKVGGNYYGIPLEIDGLLLYYNEDIIKSANVAIPTTWIEMQDIVPKITVKEKGRIITSAVALGTAENIEHFSDILTLMMLQNGTQLTKSLFSCADTSSNSCAVEALSFYRKFAEAPNNTWDETLENSIIAFAGGKVAMIFAPSWQVFTIKAMNPNLNFKTAVVPQLPCQSQTCPTVNLASYWVEGVSSKSKNISAAWEFLKYLSEKENLQKMYEEQMKSRKYFGEPYSRIDMGQLLVDNSFLAPLIASAPTMKSFYLISRTYDGDSGINTSLINYLKDAVNSLSQGVSPQTALETADNGFKQVFSRFGITASQQ